MLRYYCFFMVAQTSIIPCHVFDAKFVRCSSGWIFDVTKWTGYKFQTFWIQWHYGFLHAELLPDSNFVDIIIKYWRANVLRTLSSLHKVHDDLFG